MRTQAGHLGVDGHSASRRPARGGHPLDSAHTDNRQSCTTTARGARRRHLAALAITVLALTRGGSRLAHSWRSFAAADDPGTSSNEHGQCSGIGAQREYGTGARRRPSTWPRVVSEPDGAFCAPVDVRRGAVSGEHYRPANQRDYAGYQAELDGGDQRAATRMHPVGAFWNGPPNRVDARGLSRSRSMGGGRYPLLRIRLPADYRAAATAGPAKAHPPHDGLGCCGRGRHVRSASQQPRSRSTHLPEPPALLAQARALATLDQGVR